MIHKPGLVLGLLLAAFFLLQSLLPLKTAIQIGADEGFELAKATLCLKGHKLYAEVWNDQPPLHTFLVTQILNHFSPAILGPRLLTSAFTAMLLGSLFVVVHRCAGLRVAGLTAALLLLSPGFLELSSSCMLEIPSLATAIAGLCVLMVTKPNRWRAGEWIAGALFGAALLMKLVPVIYLALAALILWLKRPVDAKSRQLENAATPPGAAHPDANPGSRTITPTRIVRFLLSFLALGLALGVSAIAIDLLVDDSAFFRHFQQTLTSHFAPARSLDYGSAEDHPFAWIVLVRNWDTVVPAILGIAVLLRQARKTPAALVPLAWFALCLCVFAFHRPWWPYYYIHVAIPLCWCAASGISALLRRAVGRRPADAPAALEVENGKPGARAWTPSRRNWIAAATLALFALCALPWMAARIYLQVRGIRQSPQTYGSPVLSEIQRFKPFTDWFYADDIIYSFHAGIPVPCQLAVLPLKRFWCGEMTNARMVSELRTCKPGLILLKNDGREVAFQELLGGEYRLVYQDGANRLYAHASIARKPPL